MALNHIQLMIGPDTQAPLYSIDVSGNIISLATGKVKSVRPTGTGYLQVNLCVDKQEKTYLVHRVVAFSLVPGYFKGAVINHKDGVKSNNHPSNLEWVTPSENQKHAFRAGLQVITEKATIQPKPVRAFKNGRLYGVYNSLGAAAKATKTSVSKVCLVCQGKRLTTGGFNFEYINN